MTFLSADNPDVINADAYVAMGDSYQSGQGAGAYEAGTDNDGNGCRRSANAYPNQLVDDGVVRLTLDFQACSGAVISDFYNSQYDDQGPQLDALGSDTRLVTVGIVGNDLQFSDTITKCIITAGGNLVSGALTWWRSCARNQGPTVDARIESLRDGQMRTNLKLLYRDIRDRAPNARVIVLDYPQFFTDSGVGGYGGCSFIRSSDQVWINEKIRQADEAIGQIAAEAGFEYVSMADVLEGHETCTSQAGMNSVILTDKVASFHPNALGHRLIADRLEDHIATPVEPTFVIRSQETVTSHHEIRGSVLNLNITWPGSDVVTSLISPSGVRYDRDNTHGAEHASGPTWEYWTIADPEPGTWTVESFGADVADEGEPVVYTLVDRQSGNESPTAAVNTTHDGSTYTFDATGSTDEDGTIESYEWEFADGTVATGPVVTHTFTAAGLYDVTLVTTDDDGAMGFGYSEEPIRISSIPDGASVDVSSDLHVTNDVALGSPGEQIHVRGDLDCDSTGRLVGNVLVDGDVRLTNSCQIEGSLVAGGSVSMTATPVVTGDVTAVGPITLQSTARIGGTVTSGATITSIDGATHDRLVEGGTVGGSIVEGSDVAPPDLGPSPAIDVTSISADQSVTWGTWLHDIATTAAAPSWMAGLSAQPGCALASWSVGTSTVDVETSTVVDATSATSGCATVSMQGLTLRLADDLTLVVDSLQSTNGLTVVSADGYPHALRLLTPGEVSASGDQRSISLLGGTTTDDVISVEIGTPGTVVLSGGVTTRAQVAAGGVRADGRVRRSN